jgi:hypothetical protein
VACLCANKPDGCGAAGISDAADIDCEAATQDEAQPTAMQIKACRAAERLSKYRKKQLISHNSPSSRARFVDSACPIHSFARELDRSQPSPTLFRFGRSLLFRLVGTAAQLAGGGELRAHVRTLLYRIVGAHYNHVAVLQPRGNVHLRAELSPEIKMPGFGAL